MRKDCPNKGRAQSLAKETKGGGKGFKGGYGAPSAGKGLREVQWSAQDQLAICLGKPTRDLHEVTVQEPRAKLTFGDCVDVNEQKRKKFWKKFIVLI